MDELFRRKLRSYEGAPPGDIWEGISNHLYAERKHKRRAQWRVAASLLAVLAAGSLLMLQVNTPLNISGSHQAVTQTDGSSFKNFVREPASAPLQAEEQEQVAGLSQESGGQKQTLSTATNREETINEDSENGRLRTRQDIQKKQSLNAVLPVSREPATRLAQESSGRTSPRNFPVVSSARANIGPDESIPYSALNIKAAMSPVMSFRNVTSNSSHHDFNTSESHLFSYGGGVNVGLSFSERLTFRSGLHYSQMGQTLSKILLGADDFARSGDNIYVKLNNSLGEVKVRSGKLIKAKPPESLENIVDGSRLQKFTYTLDASVIQRFEYLRIPLMLEYKVVDKKMDVNILGGLHSNFLINEGVYLKNDRGNTQLIGNTNNITRFNYSGTLGLGLEYSIASQINMYLEPTLDYFLNPIHQDETKTYPYSFAVYTGLSVSF
ncbi:MAG TPA: outer membrane beta-barrel protein [Bacteroidales bacterium]|nr:outer membrane beta-barrel protein [Bacteroidales bacterium]